MSRCIFGNMKNVFLCFVLFLLTTFLFVGCHSSKKAEKKKPKTEKSSKKGESKQVSAVIKKALSYEGTKYKYSGIDKRGIDCSGLMYVSFKEAGIELPRSSYEQSKSYKSVKLSDVRKGDLLFFATGNDKNKISHVGLVIEVFGNKDFLFIHSSTQRGVCKDKLSQEYYRERFIKAVRVF